MGPETPPHKAELLEKKTEVEPKSWREPAQREKPRRCAAPAEQVDPWKW